MRKPKLSPQDFFTSRKVFTTSEAKQAGLTKSDLKKHPDLVCFGAFPVRQLKGVRIENVWTCNEELVKLTVLAKKTKKTAKNQAQVQEAVQRIEVLIRDILGFNLPTGNNNIQNEENKNGTIPNEQPNLA